MFSAAAGQVVAQGIGIIETVRSKLIKRRVRIRRTFFLGWQRQGPLPDPHFRAGRQEARKQQKNEGPSGEGSHAVRMGVHASPLSRGRALQDLAQAIRYDQVLPGLQHPNSDHDGIAAAGQARTCRRAASPWIQFDAG